MERYLYKIGEYTIQIEGENWQVTLRGCVTEGESPTPYREVVRFISRWDAAKQAERGPHAGTDILRDYQLTTEGGEITVKTPEWEAYLESENSFHDANVGATVRSRGDGRWNYSKRVNGKLLSVYAGNLGPHAISKARQKLMRKEADIHLVSE